MASEHTGESRGAHAVPAPLMVVLVLSVFAMAIVALVYAVRVGARHSAEPTPVVASPAPASSK
jgi:hypothetical protein